MDGPAAVDGSNDGRFWAVDLPDLQVEDLAAQFSLLKREVRKGRIHPPSATVRGQRTFASLL